MPELTTDERTALAKGWTFSEATLGYEVVTYSQAGCLVTESGNTQWRDAQGKPAPLPDWSGDLNKTAELLLEMGASIECWPDSHIVVDSNAGLDSIDCEPTVEGLCLAICEAYLAWKEAQ